MTPRGNSSTRWVKFYWRTGLRRLIPPLIGLLVALLGAVVLLHHQNRAMQHDEPEMSGLTETAAKSLGNSNADRTSDPVRAQQTRDAAFRGLSNREPLLLVSWRCAKTEWSESPNVMYVRGIVKNASMRQLSDVKAEAKFESAEGALLDKAIAKLGENPLAPAKTSAFFAFSPADPRMEHCSVSFRSREGPIEHKAARQQASGREGSPLTGRWFSTDRETIFDFFPDGTVFVMTDRGVPVWAGEYALLGAQQLGLDLALPPEGNPTGHLHWQERWRELQGIRTWVYSIHDDKLVLLSRGQEISLVRPDGEQAGRGSENPVLEVQVRLKAEGFDPGPLDGIFGPKTQAALQAFQKSRRLEPTGKLNSPTLRLLGLEGG